MNRTQLHDRTKAGVSNSFHFVNPATSKVDCNVAKVSECVELNTGTELTALQVRAIGQDLSGPTGSNMAHRVFLHEGMAPGKDFTIFENADIQMVRALLDDEWHVVLYVHYGTLVDTPNFPVGSKTYRAAHAIAVYGWARRDGIRVVMDGDPTFDGRVRKVPGFGVVHYPFGAQMAPFRPIRLAAAEYAGGLNLASGYAVRVTGGVL